MALEPRYPHELCPDQVAVYLPDFFSAPNATNLISESPGAPRAHTALLAMQEAVRVPAV